MTAQPILINRPGARADQVTARRHSSIATSQNSTASSRSPTKMLRAPDELIRSMSAPAADVLYETARAVPRRLHHDGAPYWRYGAESSTARVVDAAHSSDRGLHSLEVNARAGIHAGMPI